MRMPCRSGGFPVTVRARPAPARSRKATSGSDGAVLGFEEFVVAVANGDLADAGDVADLALGHLLVGEEGGGVDGGGGETDRRLPAVQTLLGRSVEKRPSATLGLLREVELGDEPRDVALRVGGFDLQAEFADDVAVGARNLLLLDAGD